MHKLGASVQLAKENWQFGFSEDSCVFIKSKRYKEKDGMVTSVFNIRIPLDKVTIEPELKSYDAFFRCTTGNLCIDRTWLNAEGEPMEERKVDSASLYLKDSELASYVFNRFTYLRTLCDRSNYPGPAGLKWGDSIEDSTSMLEGRFTLKTNETIQNGALYQQIYGETFADMATESIQVKYVDNKFYDFLAIFGYEDEKSIAKKWYAVVTKMINKYGKPNEVILPKSIKNLDEVVNRKLFDDFTVFDMEIRENSWIPQATWNYKNNVIIAISVVPTTSDWKIHWRFYHVELLELSQTRVAEHPVDDF